MSAKPAVLNFTHAEMKYNGKPLVDPLGRLPAQQGGRPQTSMQRKQIRARARRTGKIATEALNKLYKPLDEWDEEELARGRPRAIDGSFKGKRPAYIDMALHEEIVKKFTQVIKFEMNGHAVKALAVIGHVLADEAEDEKGRPMVPAATKLDAAKFLIEHVIGKPKQRVETDISVKLQGILATVMVNPSLSQPGSYELTQGYVDADSRDDDKVEDDG